MIPYFGEYVHPVDKRYYTFSTLYNEIDLGVSESFPAPDNFAKKLLILQPESHWKCNVQQCFRNNISCTLKTEQTDKHTKYNGLVLYN